MENNNLYFNKIKYYFCNGILEATTVDYKVATFDTIIGMQTENFSSRFKLRFIQ